MDWGGWGGGHMWKISRGRGGGALVGGWGGGGGAPVHEI